jgi:tetratricopeptide (TPR) repeat protein
MRTIPEPQYYPSPLEMTILILMVAELLAICYLAKRYWERKGEVIPTTWAMILWGTMVGAFAGALTIFYVVMPDPVYIDDPFARANAELPTDPRLRLTLWAFFMWLIPMGYSINILRNSFSAFAVDHIGPLSGPIKDPSEFADARRLALRGDVAGAVAKYRAYDHNKAEALFEAARLLKSEDHFDEAAAMFEEIMKNTPGNRRIWAEACYQLAKIHELAKDNAPEAKRLLRLLLQRAPETRYGELASVDLARLQTIEDILDDGEHVPVAAPDSDPFFNENDIRVRTRTKSVEGPSRRSRQVAPEEDDAPAPTDPFFGGSHLRKASEKLAERLAQNGHSDAPLKPEAKKPAPAKKPAAAKVATTAKAATATKATAAKAAAPKASAAPTKKAAAAKPAAKKKPTA